ncbi:MAG TPA: hydroxypyruvate isomerase [Gammaproteobacteria bacterium]|nr:hydroxypyruvate isomerase [Gammaproteobacteria bacterium]
MPKICANLSMLFNEYDFLDKFERVSIAGFKGVEYLFPYDFSASDIRERLDQFELEQVLFNLPAGDWGAGERGISCHPGRVSEFREGVDKAIEYAGALNCKQCNALAGIVPDGVSQQQAHETFVENLRFAAEKLQAANIKLLAEAINTYDIPGFFLNNTKQAISLLDEVDSDNVYFQYDIYHMQRMEGELAATIEKYLNRIAHLQLADNPGRHEPGSGEINYHFLFEFIDSIGYGGWIGAEYIPAAHTEDGLGWMKQHGIQT